MLILPEHLEALIHKDAEAAYPAEACGLLIGMGRSEVRITRVVPSPNLMASKNRDRFEVSPALRLRLQKELRGTEEYLVGHYHSHPDMPAEPSATDRANAFEPDLIWLIASVRYGCTEDLRAFRIGEKRITELELYLERGVE